MAANDRQVGGNHYRKNEGEQHWDRMLRLYGPAYHIGCITKYVERYRDKNGVQDLEKAAHFLEKLIEYEKGREARGEPDAYTACGEARANATQPAEAKEPKS